MPEQDIIEKYLQMTGDSEQELFSGSMQYGMGFIEDLAKKAVENKQKIIWYEDPESPKELPTLLYRFQGI
jgi:hypothetical protein